MGKKITAILLVPFTLHYGNFGYSPMTQCVNFRAMIWPSVKCKISMVQGCASRVTSCAHSPPRGVGPGSTALTIFSIRDLAWGSRGFRATVLNRPAKATSKLDMGAWTLITSITSHHVSLQKILRTGSLNWFGSWLSLPRFFYLCELWEKPRTTIDFATNSMRTPHWNGHVAELIPAYSHQHAPSLVNTVSLKTACFQVHVDSIVRLYSFPIPSSYVQNGFYLSIRAQRPIMHLLEQNITW